MWGVADLLMIAVTCLECHLMFLLPPPPTRGLCWREQRAQAPVDGYRSVSRRKYSADNNAEEKFKVFTNIEKSAIIYCSVENLKDNLDFQYLRVNFCWKLQLFIYLFVSTIISFYTLKIFPPVSLGWGWLVSTNQGPVWGDISQWEPG